VRYIVDQDSPVARAPDRKFPRTDLVEADALVLDDDRELTRTRVVGASHAGGTFERARLTDVELVRCDLAGADFSEATFTRVVLVDCRANALEAGQATLRDVALVDCVLRDANLRLSKLTSVRFAGSSLAGAEFIDARLEDVEFTSTDLTRANFANARCKNVDLREARLDELQGVGSLAGARITLEQSLGLAPSLASAVGIVLAARDDPPIQSPPVGTTGGG
jgi:uncharacterized protein YjbI with pentapeptide repeats